MNKTPKTDDSTMISIRIPKNMLGLIREFASRERIGYQVLIKRWLDDRLREEAEQMRAQIKVKQAGNAFQSYTSALREIEGLLARSPENRAVRAKMAGAVGPNIPLLERKAL